MDNDTEVVDSPQQTELNLADVSTDDLRQAISTQQPYEATEQTEQAEPEGQPQEEAIVQEEPVAEESEATEETVVPEETEEDRLAKRRIRPKSELDQQVIDLYRSEGFSGTFADASRIIYGQTVVPNQPNPQPAQQTEQPISNSFTGLAETLNAEIAELEAEVTQAADDLDTVKALQLQREIMKKELEVRDLNFRKERQEEKAQEAHSSNQRSKAQESRDRAFESYPDLSDKNTVYRKEFDDFVAHAQNDADYEAVFQSPRWPEMLAHDFAARKGYQAPIQQNATNPAPEIPKQVAPQMGNQAKVLTTGQTAQPANTQLTPEYVSNNIGQMSNEQLYQLLGHDDGRKFLR